MSIPDSGEEWLCPQSGKEPIDSSMEDSTFGTKIVMVQVSIYVSGERGKTKNTSLSG